MPATKYQMVIPQSGTYRLVIDVVGGPESLAGYTGLMQVRQVKASDEILAEVGPSAFTVDDGNRQVVLEIPSEDTELYAWFGSAVYDLYVEGPSGDRWRLLEGVAILSKTVTREE